MTYRMLMKKISKLNNDQLDTEVTVFNTFENIFVNVLDFKIDKINNDDDDEPFLVI